MHRVFHLVAIAPSPKLVRKSMACGQEVGTKRFVSLLDETAARSVRRRLGSPLRIWMSTTGQICIVTTRNVGNGWPMFRNSMIYPRSIQRDGYSITNTLSRDEVTFICKAEAAPSEEVGALLCELQRSLNTQQRCAL